MSVENPDRLTWNLVFAAFAGGVFPGFQHGYSTGVTNAPTDLIKEWLMDCPEHLRAKGNLTRLEQVDCVMTEHHANYIVSFIVACFAIGGMIGGLLIGILVAILGQKKGILSLNLLVYVSALLMWGSVDLHSGPVMILGRVLIGVAAGAGAGLAPMYLSEVAPVAYRGAVCTVYQLMITVSILMSQVFGLPQILGSRENWPMLFLVIIAPALMNNVLMFFTVESPKFLFIEKKQPERAAAALKWLRQTEDVSKELERYAEEAKDIGKSPKAAFRILLKDPAFRKPLWIAAMMMLAQQLTGINAVMFYSNSIFLQSGLNREEATLATILTGASNVLATVVSLALIERLGRKTLMVGGLSGMLCFTVLLLICQLLKDSGHLFKIFSVIAVVCYVLSFAIGPGPVPWFLVSELFEQNARPPATALAVILNWMANFLVGQVFLPVQTAIGEYVFLIFIAFQVVFILYVWKFVPETRGRTTREISDFFKTPDQLRQEKSSVFTMTSSTITSDIRVIPNSGEFKAKKSASEAAPLSSVLLESKHENL